MTPGTLVTLYAVAASLQAIMFPEIEDGCAGTPPTVMFNVLAIPLPQALKEVTVIVFDPALVHDSVTAFPVPTTEPSTPALHA